VEERGEAKYTYYCGLENYLATFDSQQLATLVAAVVLGFNYEAHNAPAYQISTQSDVYKFQTKMICCC